VTSVNEVTIVSVEGNAVRNLPNGSMWPALREKRTPIWAGIQGKPA
jgi:hypothetical protein